MTTPAPPAPPAPRRSATLTFVVALLLIGAIAALAWWILVRNVTGNDTATVAEVEQVAGPLANEFNQSEGTERGSHWKALLGHEPLWPDDFDDPRQCDDIELDLARLCAEIDRRPYRSDDRRLGGTCGLLREVADALAAHPPDSAGEIKRHASMLANIFHLSRTVDGKAFQAARRVLREEEYLVEPLAMTLWRWSASREQCARSGRTSMTAETMYAYAAYLFETFGGRSALQRRSPRTEALISFYALLIIDRSDRRGYNPQGVDPSPWLRRTRDLVERQNFHFADEYLTRLDTIAARWSQRIPGNR